MEKTPATWRRRALWFIALWTVGVCALAVLAYGLRVFMRALGLSL